LFQAAHSTIPAMFFPPPRLAIADLFPPAPLIFPVRDILAPSSDFYSFIISLIGVNSRYQA
jgi:hypothetical protein